MREVEGRCSLKARTLLLLAGLILTAGVIPFADPPALARTEPSIGPLPIPVVREGRAILTREPHGTRDVLGCWSEPLDPLYPTGISSEIIAWQGLESELANDFIFAETREITTAWWWGSICESGWVCQGFNLRIYADDSCKPGALLLTTEIMDNANETIVGQIGNEPIFEYHTPMSFIAEAGVRYWFSAQAKDHPYPPTWYRMSAAQVTGCGSQWRSQFFGYPNWTETREVIGFPIDAAQVFDCRAYITFHHTPIEPTETENQPFEVTATIHSEQYPLNPADSWIGYRVGSPGTWVRTPMEHLGTDTWRGVVPGQEQPAEIAYYLHAKDVAGNEVTDPRNGPADPYRFDVARHYEPFEADGGGFVVNLYGTDTATSGIWERAVPEGAIGEPSEDHTRTGTTCWITNVGSVGGPPNQRGETTLFTPAYDLHGATFAKAKYWRWYSNDRGSDPGLERWVVNVRNDGGFWWVIEDTNVTTGAWVPASVDLFEWYGQDIGVVDMRFVASMSVSGQQRIVEAAVDDFELLVDYGTAGADTPVRDGVFSFAGPSPNPCAGSTVIRFNLPADGHARVRLMDVSGRLVRTLVDGNTVAGSHAVPWDGLTNEGRPAAAGMYYAVLETGSVRARRPVALIR